MLVTFLGVVGAARAQTPAPAPGPTETSTAAPTPAPAPPQSVVPDATTVDLYNLGRQLIAEGKWAEACPKFDAVLATTVTAKVLISVGDCRAHEGKLTAAYAAYDRARIVNPATQPAERRVELDALIQRQLKDLLPRLPKLQVAVEKALPGLVVRRDGDVVQPGAFGVDLPVDPGAHEVTAEAPGFLPQKYAVSLKEGEKQTVRVVLTAPPESVASRYAGAIVAGSVAVVLGGVTAGLGAWTVSTHHDIVTRCAEGEQACKDEAAALQSRGTVTNVFLGLAGAAAVTAGVLVLVERSKTPKVEVAVSGTGVFVRGRW